MCNFMGVRVSKVNFIRLKQIEKELGTLAAMKELELIKDGFRYSNSLIIRKQQGAADIEVVSAHWEFIPVWIKNGDEVKNARKQGIPWLNARSETVLESKMFGNAARKRRCLVLATHFFEWRHYKPEGEKKAMAYPYTIGVNYSEYFYLAGIWQPWTDRETGETIDTFAIVTTQANELMSQVHNTKNRMPTILPEDLAYEWIMEDLSEDRIKEIASYQLPSDEMYAYTIPKDFKALEEPCTPFEYSELPDLDIAL
ncbi:MAG: SOS response-associated peptidase [Sediminibacterium sp. Gen4]|nr:SOS response-associated peptidase [Sediminibacterium sp.]MBW0164996.1 SOS response-associated peptidase [Sediminibacterium sp.]NWK64451.1 SOS response-associated peptidase [Sediminibacterium sp. Gen4]